MTTKTAPKPAARKPAAKKAPAPLLAKALDNTPSMSETTAGLLTGSAAWQPGETATLQYLPLDHVHPAADNPRAHLGDLTDLAQSIKTAGVLEPILVRLSPVVRIKPLKPGDGPEIPVYQIVAGHRRHAAARIAELELIPCIVRTFTEQARIEAMVIENLQRKDLSPFDEARGLTQLVNVGLTQRDIAKRVGCSQSHVSKRLALAAMPAAAEQLFVAESMTIQQVEELAKVPDVDQVAVVGELVARAASAKDSLLPNWAIADTINQLKTKRKHLEAEKVGVASGLKRITDRPYDSPGGTHRICKKAEATHWYLHERDTHILWARTQAAHNKVNPPVAQTTPDWRLRQEAGERIDAFIGNTILPAVQANELAGERIDAFIGNTILPAVQANELARAMFVAQVTKLARHRLDVDGQRMQIHVLGDDAGEEIGDDDALYVAIAMLCDLAGGHRWQLAVLELFIEHGYRTTGVGETYPEGFDPTPILIVEPGEPVPEPAAS